MGRWTFIARGSFFGLLNLRQKGLSLMIAEAGALAGIRKAELGPESSIGLFTCKVQDWKESEMTDAMSRDDAK